MTKPKTCAAGFETADGKLVCSLPAGHDGPVHRSEDGHEWGDQALQQPDPANAPT